MLPAEIISTIAAGQLRECHDADNCYFIVSKAGGVGRLYYLINNRLNIPNIDCQEPLVAEILFRGNTKEPDAEVAFLTACGFKRNLRRDQYAAPILESTVCMPVFAKNTKDAHKAINLFNVSFDKFSGDYIEPSQAEELFENKSLLCAYRSDGVMQGALEASFNGRNAWVSHLVVEKQFRGQGVGNHLMNMFVNYAWLHGCKRLMLWVQHQNESAISLYKKFNFNYTNKSTISFIKE